MTNSNPIFTQFSTLGIIALIPSELPDHRILEVADALLAAPVLATQIVPNGDNAFDTIQTFRQRAGDNMLIGLDRVETLDELKAAIKAGAQFASSGGDFHLPLLAYAKKHDFAFIPTVHSPGQTLMAYHAGARWQKIRDDIDADGLEGLLERSAEIGYQPNYIINQIETGNIDVALEIGAKMVCVNDIYLDHDQPMSDIILRARAARRIWLDTQL